MTQPYTDVGVSIANALLDQVNAAVGQMGADQPGWVGLVGGAAVPTVDACDGMIWARVANQYPTDGSGVQQITTRFDSSIPAWVVSIELGHLWCHPVIEEDGGSPDLAAWADCAARDGQYRLIVLQAIRTLHEAAEQPIRDVVMGQTIAPWAPIGPDGGYSGGLVVVNYIVSALALC